MPKVKVPTVPPSALGWKDPREIKEELEKRGISCWLDIHHKTSSTGLFRNITEGIRNAKVLLVCVSDEYVQSDNCMMEIRFGVLNMNIPTVIAVVGTGKEWKQSEVGILMQRSKADKVYFQSENPSAMDTVESYIRQRLPDNVDQIIKKEAATKNIQTLQEKEKTKNFDKSAMQEEYELVQRKFMRHIISYVSSHDTVPLPRLIVVDFERQESKQDLDKTEQVQEGSKRSSLLRPTMRPRTANRSSRAMKAVSEDELEMWEGGGFCFKVLCEHEEGWHVCKIAFPVKVSEEFKNMLKGCSAYLARMYAILRQSAVTLNCFDGSKGDKFLAWIEQCAVGNIAFVDSFVALRTKLLEDESAQSFLFQLGRFHLPTGKIYWMCEEHAKGPRVTRLSTESASAGEVGHVLEEEDTKMKDIIEKSTDYKKKKASEAPKKKLNLPESDFAVPQPSTSTDQQSIKQALTMHQAMMNKAASKCEPQNEKPIPEEADLGKREAKTNSEEKIETPKIQTPTASARRRSVIIRRSPAPTRTPVSRASDKNDRRESKTCVIQ